MHFFLQTAHRKKDEILLDTADGRRSSPPPGMRILTVNNSSDLYGASRCLERVFARLAADGHQVFAVVPGDGPLVPLLRSQGITVLFHPRLSIIDRRRMGSARGLLGFLLHWPGSVLWLALQVMRLRIDLVHTNTAVMPTPALAALLTRRPHVWHLREFFGEFGSLWTLYQRYIFRLSQQVIAISTAVRDQFAPQLRDRVTVVYDGLPAEWGQGHDDAGQSSESSAALRQRFSLPNGPLIGVIGRIKWVRKGQEIAVEAFAQLMVKYPDAHLVIVGSAAEGNEEHLTRLAARVEELGASSRVCFTGDLEATAALYAAMDITVVPSIQPEPFGCVVMESMAAGTPVIGSQCGGIAEQIVDGQSGLLFTPGDVAALACCLDRLLSDPALRARLAEGGYRRYRSHFQLQQTCAETLLVFAQAAAGRRRNHCEMDPGLPRTEGAAAPHESS